MDDSTIVGKIAEGDNLADTGKKEQQVKWRHHTNFLPKVNIAKEPIIVFRKAKSGDCVPVFIGGLAANS